MTEKPFPILFITASRVGDAVLSSGLIRTLAKEVPAARFTIVASALTAPLFACVPGLERVIVMDKKPAGAHWLGLWNKVRDRHWGLVVDLRGSSLSQALRRTRRAVHKKEGESVHKVIEAARLLHLEETPPAPFLYTSPAVEARAAALTAGQGPILAVAPAANWIGKIWPAERFALIARHLLKESGPLAGGRLMILGGPGDQVFTDPVKAAVQSAKCIDLVGREDLLVCFAALKRARLFVGNDSGLMHLAAAAGAPTLGLFGPSDERLYAPWGPWSRTVRGTRSFESHRKVDPGLNQALCHMMELAVPTVLTEARSLLADTQPERFQHA